MDTDADTDMGVRFGIRGGTPSHWEERRSELWTGRPFYKAGRKIEKSYHHVARWRGVARTTGMGVLVSPVRPSCCAVLEPNVKTAPEAVTARLWARPAATRTTCGGGVMMRERAGRGEGRHEHRFRFSFLPPTEKETIASQRRGVANVGERKESKRVTPLSPSPARAPSGC